MRFVTFRADKDSGNQAPSNASSTPGLLVDSGVIVDLRQAISSAGARGAAYADIGAPISLVDIIAGGAAMLEACSEIAGEAKAGKIDPSCSPAESVRLLAPIPRPSKNVFCVGSNYRAHVTESSRAQSKPDRAPDYPVFFTKPPTCVIGTGEAIRIDPGISEKIDYEVELGVVFGKTGRNIPAAQAGNHIFGFTIINDVTARDIQRRHGGQFLKGKGLDTFCPMGPQIVTIDELSGYDDLRIRTSINGEARQDGNTGNMIFSIPTLVESLSEGMTLEPGDILATGTPSGVGYAMDPPQYLRDGDTVVCEIEGIGKLENTVLNVASAASAVSAA